MMCYTIKYIMTKEDKEKTKIYLIIVCLGYQSSHFDYLGHYSVN